MRNFTSKNEKSIVFLLFLCFVETLRHCHLYFCWCDYARHTLHFQLFDQQDIRNVYIACRRYYYKNN